MWLFSPCDRGIFQVLGQMKMDMVNYTIQSLQPQLQEHSIQFERAQFQERLNKEPSMYAVRGGMAPREAWDLASERAVLPPLLEGGCGCFNPVGQGWGKSTY